MSNFLGKTLGKFVGQSPNNSNSGLGINANNLSKASLNISAQSPTHHEIQLTLTHLRKVFYEYLHPRQELTQLDRDEKLYNLLPLFIKAFTHVPTSDIADKFSECAEFCYSCSRLLVSEISKRGKDDLLLVKFLEIKSSDETSDGYGLLTAVNLLASGPQSLIEIMCKCALPSRLLMCVYLFMCLPEVKDSMLDYSEFSATERRTLFQKSFQQVIVFFFNFLTKFL